jgi:glycosyltransferase involved in cell wall biosynthesis
MSYAVLIPARNEAAALPHLFEALGRLGPDGPWRTVVVDNGSTDDTADVARGLGAEVVDEPRPGYGQACLAGLGHLASDPPAVVVFLDADDFVAPAQIPLLLAPFAAGDADLVVGERAHDQGDPGVRWHARLGNHLVTGIMNRRFGSRVHDMGPFRAIGWEALRSLSLDDRNYGWYVQMQVRALRSGLRVVGVPVEFERRSVGKSKVSGDPIASMRAGVVMLRTLAVEILRKPAGGERRRG